MSADGVAGEEQWEWKRTSANMPDLDILSGAVKQRLSDLRVRSMSHVEGHWETIKPAFAALLSQARDLRG